MNVALFGIPASNAINMFYKQIILQRGLPFEVKMPASRLVDASILSDAESDAEIDVELEKQMIKRLKRSRKQSKKLRQL